MSTFGVLMKGFVEFLGKKWVLVSSRFASNPDGSSCPRRLGNIQFQEMAKRSLPVKLAAKKRL
eukprot:2625274-Pyramimonas_sp.AAC.1